MTGRRWLIAAVVATLLGGSGCVSSGHKGYALARDAGSACDVPTGQRNQVYVLAIGGNTPTSAATLDRFREGLNAAGFAKVATGQPLNAWWLAGEMRRIHVAEPDAVFVLVGLGTGEPVAAKLAEKAVVDGLPIQALVFSDSAAPTSLALGNVQTLMLGSGANAMVKAQFDPADTTALPPAALPDDPRNITAVVNLLNEVAVRTAPTPAPATVTEWSYRHAPEVRPVVVPGPDPEWAFLFDRPGGMTGAISRSLVPTVLSPSSPATNAVARP